jgi:hypothetical protein
VNVAFDIDGTLTAAPQEMTGLAQNLVRRGHKVYVITYRDEDWRPMTQAMLDDLRFPYSKLLMMPHWSMESAAEFKAKMVLRHRIAVMIDNDPVVLAAMPEGVRRVLVRSDGMKVEMVEV